MSTDADLPPLGPGAQAVRLSFWFVAALVVLAACAWAGSNIRRIPPDSRAVVLRFGAFVRTQDAGLLIAWPRPFESTLLVPGSARVLEQRIQSLERDPRARAADMTVPEAAPSAQAPAGPGTGTSTGTGAVIGPDDGPPNSPVTPDNAGGPDAAGPDATPPVAQLPDALAGSGYVLTGDNGVLQLRATLYYRVVDPYAYVLQQDRLAAALERIVSASAVDVVAQRDLDAILVARPELLSADQQVAIKRERLRGDLAQEIERHLRQLEAQHAGLGVEVARVDVEVAFPAAAVGAFNSVLTSLQVAERSMAEARTSAEKTRQDAQQDADRIVQNAEASAVERVATAQAKTMTIQQLEVPLRTNSDPGLLARVYRDRVQSVLSKAGNVTTVGPHDTSNLILPGNAR
ncbi:SPFH domain-containing protein [Paraburkholderia fungorum]|uniref:Regulator of protease activity HflC (Stomatin/prohibitin superfamily) n=1 Tax=Paraburkholderia fungorum TaxID=134537 RepID=A0AAW3UVD3_9BURK|nr:SPFH domain-containing protein [Paraburkholderia fungorum]MBB4513835.1 regulator of protease activity HflC (stomatin/prohibitin superfamily) [Paraburkholderia fungorum]MBB6201076.1 regulator of protease activity HflC (stomatin/prohibitin superfamily) [Paraburkholderia fungorum]